MWKMLEYGWGCDGERCTSSKWSLRPRTNDLGHGWYSNSKYGYFQKLGVSMIIPAYWPCIQAQNYSLGPLTLAVNVSHSQNGCINTAWPIVCNNTAIWRLLYLFWFHDTRYFGSQILSPHGADSGKVGLPPRIEFVLFFFSWWSFDAAWSQSTMSSKSRFSSESLTSVDVTLLNSSSSSEQDECCNCNCKVKARSRFSVWVPWAISFSLLICLVVSQTLHALFHKTTSTTKIQNWRESDFGTFGNQNIHPSRVPILVVLRLIEIWK